jgi:hypothetical protein
LQGECRSQPADTGADEDHVKLHAFAYSR